MCELMQEQNDLALVPHRGGCHCGGVSFSVLAPAVLPVVVCNCSRCNMLGYEHLLVAGTRFELLSGRELLTSYQFGTRTADHLFCSRCGVQSFYVPRSNPDGYSVNVRCLQPGTISGRAEESFDGQHWEHHGPALAERTEP